MNKTSEALREEIAEIYRERSVMDLTKADEIINKVLDAVESSINESCDEAYGWNDREHLLTAINKLRPGQ